MVLIEDVDEEEEREALKAAAKAASQQWRRIQVVQEDSDDDAPVAPAASEQSVQHSGVSDPCPDLSILCSRAGAEEAKRHGNRLFGEGKVAECERWFSKALWLYESGRVRDFPGDLRCALHSNRALARLKLQRFRDAEEDCSAALEDNPQNAKARYRRAMARLELGKLVPGLEDVERALKELPEDSRQEAQDLKVRIQEQLATPEGPAGTAKQPTPKGREKKEPTKAEDSGYKRIHVKEVDEDKKEASKPETTAEKTHVNGHAQQEPYPDIQLEPTMQGAEKAKQRANELFQKGSLEESARWFSKAIWLLESGKVPGATASLRSVLHSNRAFARSKLQQWTGVEEDCTEALALNESNAKALYRRSQARLELNKLDAALEDVQQLLPLLAAPADQEAQDLKKRILEQQAKAKKTLEKAKEASVKAEQRDDAKAPPPAGFKRMEIVEASDSEEEEETKAPTKVEAPKATPTSEKAPPPAGFKRMEIVEASDSEEEETKAAAKVEAPKAVLTSSQDQKDKEMFPELKFEFSRKGVEAAKNTGGQLFSKQDLQGASRHFSKALWMLQSGKVADAQSDASWCNATRLALHSNRAFSELRQENWKAAEDDCTEALKIDPKAVKALYRRAMAREKMGRAAEALKDADEALKLQPGAEELVTLQKRLKAAETPAPQPKSPEDQSQKTAPPPAGFKRMEIVEASDSDEEEPAQTAPAKVETAKATPTSEKAPPPAGFKRMEIVEASDSDEEEPAKTAPAKVETAKATPTSEKATKDQDFLPELKFEFSRKGVEAAKNTGGQLFSKQDLQGASRHFSKALWMLQSGKVADAQSDVSWCNSTRLALHSNRAFSELRQENWKAAEDDCTEALKIDPKAVKALYRRAMAREKMGRAAEALKDADEALKLQPGAEELATLQKRLKAAEPPAQPKSPEGQSQKTAPPPAGFKRMEIVEASDSDEDEPAKTAAAKVEAATAPPTSEKAPPPAGFKRMEIVEASDSDEDEPAKTAPAKVEAAKATPTSEKAPPPAGFKRMEIVEASDSDEEEPAKTVPAKVEAAKATPTSEKATKDPEMLPEMLPELTFEFSRKGVEAAKSAGSQLFSKQDLQGASRHFSKALWMLQSGKVADASDVSWCNSTRLALHLNRAFSELRQENWQAAEDDCAEALKIEPQAVKALYRRAMAREKMGRAAEALKDVEEALKLQPGAEELLALQKKLKDVPRVQTPPGFKRMEIVEASDDEDEQETALPSPSPKGKAMPAEPPAPKSQNGQVQTSAAPDPEMFPDLKFEFSRKGVEAAKSAGSQLFSKQDLQGASRHFSKALWMLQSGKVADASDASWCNSTRLALHSNRAFSELRQENWRAAEDDCTEALKIDPQAVKALYRRAMAREKMGRAAEALKDVDEALKLQPGAEELVALQKRLKPAPKAETGFKRMEIVEASDDDEEAQEPSTQATSASTSPKAQEAGPPADSEPCEPWDELEPTLAGVEKGKEMGNRLFSEGKIEECERWFSKAIWLAEESGKVNVPSDLRGILHSNRAFARLRLQQWLLAEEDCTQALVLNASNSKALYRRAQARLELGKRSMALEDVDKLLPMLAPPSDRDAQELRERILALPESPAKKAEMFPDLHFEFSRKGVEAAKDAGSQLFSKQDLQGASRHFSKALWMLESGKVADAESDASWCNSTRLALHSNRAFSELRQGNWQAAEEDCTEALKINPQAVKALYRRAIAREELGRKEEALKDAEAALALQPGEELVALQKRLKAATETPGVEAVKRTETEAKAPSASPTPKEAPEPEPFDDIKLEPTLAGVEKGKEMGNKLFSAGKFEECERCFSKALWLAQESGKVKAPNDIRGILHSNRAFARLRLQRWSDAEKDCDEALRLNERNAKAHLMEPRVPTVVTVKRSK
ncbi:unnamed protein product [Effrenium voratum]|uniref:Uncharacterized protein n=1 Tax=Effrenium voratum TaxID=2562239 RepID=A0AA36NC50_9DINO|nr:unnamed protein product [Effrenium voratum]